MVVAALALAALALPGTGAADPITALRARGAELARQERSTLLELYALESSIAGARSRLAAIQARIGRVERDRASARRHLRIARRTLRIAERRLGDQLRRLYEEDRPSALEILLGAESLRDALDGLDTLARAAEATDAVIHQATASRRRVSALARTLGRRRATLARLAVTQRARVTSLESAQAERAGAIERIRHEASLTSRQVASLERSARAAQERARIANARAAADVRRRAASEGRAAAVVVATAPAVTEPAAASPAPAAPPPEPPPVVTASPAGKRTLTVVVTAYALTGTTATGIPVGPGVVAVDPAVIPLGTRMFVPGYGSGVAADTGSAVKGARIDVWLPTYAEAAAWGSKTVTITLY